MALDKETFDQLLATIERFVRERLVPNEQPLGVHFATINYDTAALTITRLETFPMTPTGKIAKAELRQMAMAGAL